MTTAPKVLFMGTPDFAVPVLEEIVSHGYEVCLVMTQPDKPVGRKQRLTPPPVKETARKLGLNVLQPKKIRDGEVLEKIKDLVPDIAVTAAYGKLLPQSFLEIPRMGCLNVHASLLPRWRGAAPVHRALMAGDAKTGVTIMEMVQELDAGPIVAQAPLNITAGDDVGTLHDKLAWIGAKLLVDVLPDYLAGKMVPTPQPEEGKTYADKILSEDEIVNWACSAKQVHNHVRGLSPWPVARSSWNRQVFKIWRTRPAESSEDEARRRLKEMPSGSVIALSDKVFVQCSDGPLELVKVQPSGKRPMSAADWFRGVNSDWVRLGGAGE